MPGRRCVPHARREVHDRRYPAHVTLRTCVGLPSLRRNDIFVAVRAAFARSSREGFRLVHYSVQRDHVHLVVEAERHLSLRRGIQGLAIRVAKATNRALCRRGRVWADRYHVRALTTPREVRHALVYVLQNFIRRMVHRLANADHRSADATSSGPSADVARIRRLATAWPRAPR